MRGQPWTGQELARLVRMKDAGAKWTEVAAALPGRTVPAIMQAHYKIVNDRRRAEGRAYAQAMAAQRKLVAVERMAAPPAPAVVVAVPVVPAAPRELPEPNGRFMPTSRLVADAELRSRIAERGLTGGWFGDPAPGRSALDVKRAGKPV